ncbi:uncharacterized protein LOC112094694 [Morus notabilis]|uniref:uncharacterized protein LOC112094694 n=1 Tax=Morus notabilis TaxID=981085 RepID=UPI000CED1F7E|nr:uncharacterized protein LOC112094694 [Morus notabilis]
MNAERFAALREEVDKLIKNDFIWEVLYPAWVSNPMLVLKPNEKWRTYVDFSNLNKACPKDNFPLPSIDQLVDATAGHELLSFMDAYSIYNQIPMFHHDEEHTSFITDRGLYCYKVMPFGLKNAGATYQRLVNKMFTDQIGKTMEVYVDDMLVKSRRSNDHVEDLRGMFDVLQKPDASGRLLKWSIELSQFDIDYNPGQSLADFVTEFIGLPDEAEGHEITSAVRFEFPVSNNEAEYEVLLAEHLKVGAIDIFSDSQLIVNQVKGQYQTRDEKMAAYLKKVKETLEKLSAYDIQQVPRVENSNADALARLATSKDAELLRLVPVEVLKAPSTKGKPEVLSLSHQPSWKDPIVKYLLDSGLPEDKQHAKRLRYQASRFTMHDDILYRKGFSMPLLRCRDEVEAKNVLSEVHDGICGNHAGGQSLAYKVLRHGYYWLSLKKDAAEYAKKCEGCQRYAPIPRQHSEDLTSIASPWPFAKWGIDLIGPLHKTPGGYKYAIVTVDYFTKWSKGQVEAVNKIIKVTLKRRLDNYKGKWADELPKVLWAYRMTSMTTTGETPFSMAYGVEAVLPVKISIPTSRVILYEEDKNAERMGLELDLLEEMRTDAQLRLASYQARTARYYNKKVKHKRF